jgi:hypothetical protein
LGFLDLFLWFFDQKSRIFLLYFKVFSRIIFDFSFRLSMV